MPAAYPLELRERAVNHYLENNCTQEETAELFQIGVTTLRLYLRKNEANDLPPKDYKRGQKPVISGKRLLKIESWVNERPDIQIKTLCKKFKSYYKKKVSHSMMCRALSTLNLTRKKKSLYAEEQLRPDVKKKRKEHIEKYKNTDSSRLIFIDEMGAHLNMTLEYARAVAGTRISMPKPFIRGEKISLIGAISINKIEAAMYGNWATDGEIFTHFIENDLLPILRPEHIVLFDNVGFHKSKQVRKLIESTGAQMDLLPPYSPEMNPIEMAWSFAKAIVRKLEPRTMQQFQTAMRQALGKITEDKLVGWFEHAGYRSTH